MKLLLLSVFCVIIQSARGQLSVNKNTYWKVEGNVYTVLNDIDLKNDGGLEVDNGTFKFTGKADNFINGNQKLIFYDVVVEKQASKKITLGRDIGVTHGLIFSSGLLDLVNFNVDLASDGQLKGESESSRIVSDGDGQIIANAFLNAPQAVNPGNLGAIITSSQNLGLVTIRRGHQSQTNASGGGNSVFRYYDITPANNTAINATLRFNYFNAELNGLDENSLTMWKSENTLNWTNEGFTSRDATANFVQKTGIASFSRWTLSSIGSALPVTGLKLSGRWHDNASQLDWITLAEYNNRHFNVERRYSAENDFTVIGRRNSQHTDGNSQSLTSYHWTDPAAANRGTIVYRLQQVDLDGRYSYSSIITITPETPKLFIENLYPTGGVQQSIYVKTGTMNLRQMEISVYDMKGRLYMKKKVNYESQWLQLPSLASGIYQLQVVSGEWQHHSNFVKQ